MTITVGTIAKRPESSVAFLTDSMELAGHKVHMASPLTMGLIDWEIDKESLG